MKLFHETNDRLTLGGVAYDADENGVIEVPDELVTRNVYAQGFVDAKGRLAQLAAAAEAADNAASKAAAVKAPEPEKAAPVKKN